MKKRDKLILGTIVGGAIGSVLGSLYAPDSGEKTRKKIKKFAEQNYNKGKGIVDQHMPEVKKKSKGLIDRILNMLDDKSKK